MSPTINFCACRAGFLAQKKAQLAYPPCELANDRKCRRNWLPFNGLQTKYRLPTGAVLLLRPYRCVVFAVVLLISGVLPTFAWGQASATKGVPQDHDYQKKLRAYLATLKEADFAVPLLQPLAMPKEVSPSLAYRAWVLTASGGYGAPQFHELHIPASMFTLAAIETGAQVHRPPITPGNYAWLTSSDYPFNPYRNNRALQRRAFVASAVDLMMHDQLHELDPKGPANRSDFLGGTLIWLGYDYAMCKDAIPAEARAAYETGLKKLVRRLNEWGPRRSMTDMDLFAPVGLHYCGQATGDKEIQRIAESYTNDMLRDRRLFHPAGFFVDAGIFDASYNGISLYFTTWHAGATGSLQSRDALAKCYRLKTHLMLPEPDGRLFGPTHFNPRTSGDSANDQWAWRFRDCGAAMLTDEALACAKPPTPEELASAPAALLAGFKTALAAAPPKVKSAPWFERHWTNYPVFGELYYQAGFLERYRQLEAAKSPQLVLPFRRQENFVRKFEDHFVIAKRPGFGAVIYTGPVSTDDKKTKRPKGFGGGALSAFWTPSTGSVILGRRRGIQGPNWDRLEEWSAWPTHAVSALTSAGKITSSARIQTPTVKTDLEKDSAVIAVSGAMPSSSDDQGKVLAGTIDYERRFELSDAGLKVKTTLRSDRQDKLKELYEIVPIFLGDGRMAKGEMIRILYRAGDGWQPLPADRTVSTAKVRIERIQGAIEMEFDRAWPMKLSAKEWVDGYMTSATCRNVLIDLLNAKGADQAFETVSVSYRIAPASK